MEAGARRTGLTAWEIAARYTADFQEKLKWLNVRTPPRLVPGHRPHPRTDCNHRRYRGKRLCVPDGRRPVLRHLAPERLRPPRPPSILRACKAASASVSGRRAASRTSRCGSSARHRCSGRWNGTARGGAASRAGTSNAPPWRPSTWGRTSTSTAAVRITSRSTNTNEIAQAQACYDTRLAEFWLHGAFLQFDGEKMSKSSGDFLRLESLVEAGYDPPRLPLFLPRGALPSQAFFHLGEPQRRGHGPRSAAHSCPHLGCAV